MLHKIQVLTLQILEWPLPGTMVVMSAQNATKAIFLKAENATIAMVKDKLTSLKAAMYVTERQVLVRKKKIAQAIAMNAKEVEKHLVMELNQNVRNAAGLANACIAEAKGKFGGAIVSFAMEMGNAMQPIIAVVRVRF